MRNRPTLRPKFGACRQHVAAGSTNQPNWLERSGPATSAGLLQFPMAPRSMAPTTPQPILIAPLKASPADRFVHGVRLASFE